MNNDYLVTLEDICNIFKMGRKTALKFLTSNKCLPVLDLGLGRLRGRRWLYSQIQDLLYKLKIKSMEKSKPNKIVYKHKKENLNLYSKSTKEIMDLVSEKS